MEGRAPDERDDGRGGSPAAARASASAPTARRASSATWIRSQQRDDGTWANFHGGPGELSTTVEAYAALRLAGDPPDAEHLRRARAWIRESGGVEQTRVFTRLWFSLVGLWSWDEVPVIPPELAFLPRWFPLNLYDYACWARQTIAALAIVSAYRPTRPLGFSVDELRTGGPVSVREVGAWGPVFQSLNAALRVYQRRPPRAVRERALARLEQWIVDRQEADGSWGGIQPPWVYSLIALTLRGYTVDHPVIERGLRGLDAFTIVEGDTRRLEACQSPVWDTALAVIALADAGLPPGHDALRRAGRWLVDEEIRALGDWTVRRPGLDPGGWAFEFENDHYPDIDDTAEVVMALRRLDAAGAAEAAERGFRWTLGMASRDGGWGAFDADNTRELCRKLPFCDFGEVIDPPSADVTAHVVEMLARAGEGGCEPARRGVEWLLRSQEADGSWFGRWGANHVYGTGAAVPALVEAGIPARHPAVRAAVGWLERVQNEDGGWGEDLRSYRDETWRGRGASTASQTAWALLALHAAGEHGRAVDRGLTWLAANQLPDGSWDEPWYTGTGFPGDFYINYHLYRLVFPVMALGRYAQ